MAGNIHHRGAGRSVGWMLDVQSREPVYYYRPTSNCRTGITSRGFILSSIVLHVESIWKFTGILKASFLLADVILWRWMASESAVFFYTQQSDAPAQRTKGNEVLAVICVIVIGYIYEELERSYNNHLRRVLRQFPEQKISKVVSHTIVQ